MTTEPITPKVVAEALRLLNAHESSKQAILAFLKSIGEPGYDPVSLKLWLAEQQMKAARENHGQAVENAMLEKYPDVI